VLTGNGAANAIAGALAIVLAVAAGSKLRGPERFGFVLRQWSVVPQQWQRVAVRGVPVLELIAALLLVGADRRIAAVATAGLLVCMTIAAEVALARVGRVPCGCLSGDASGLTLGPFTRRRNGCLVGMAVTVGVLGRTVTYQASTVIAAACVAFAVLLIDEGASAVATDSVVSVGVPDRGLS
jgi:Methylamine utilisation protein MauE